MDNSLTLYELNNRVRNVLNEGMAESYWVTAELSDVRSNATGHCYMELVQKDEKSKNLIAKARATIWANTYVLLKPYFEKETGQPFESGIKVLVKVSVEFHELYGLSLTISDIEPSYTIGELARNRREILLQLEAEGVLNLNKELEIPTLPQRIAVISSATAAGYGDFCNQLKNNGNGFVFYPVLFPAIMQGERTEESIIAALNRIAKHQELWDVVVIIRGGGSTSDLSGFDTYNLATNCAQFPLPIITGIGHERDDTVIDAVAHTRVKTPTAAAELLVGFINETASQLNGYIREVTSGVTDRMQQEKHRISLLTQQMPTKVNLNIERRKHRLDLWEQLLKNASPEIILKRGYSLTLKEGKAVRDANQLCEGDRLTTKFAEGEITSIVKKN